MYKRNTSVMIRIMAIVLTVAMILPVGVSAAAAEPVQPRASDYLSSYNAYIYCAGGGKIQVWFTVNGTDYMDTLGALTIRIYESTDGTNWTWKKSFTNDTTTSMIGYNDFYHSGHVDYQGVIGRYYRAYVTIWAGKNGQGDSRYFYTSAKRAI